MSESHEMEMFWGMSRAQYLTIPRSIIQEMSKEWQDKFAKLLNELDDSVDWRPDNATYWCLLRDNETGRYISNPLAEYRHGNVVAKSLFRDVERKK